MNLKYISRYFTLILFVLILNIILYDSLSFNHVIISYFSSSKIELKTTSERKDLFKVDPTRVTTQKSEILMNRQNYSKFCVVVPVFNPASFNSRYESYVKFEKRIQAFNVLLITVELAIGNQTFQVTQSNNPNHIQLKTDDAMWYKENLINIGIRRSPKECEYIAWIDLEVEFLNKKWVADTITALQTYATVQLFEIVNIMSPQSEVLESHIGFGRGKVKIRKNTIYNYLKNKYSPSRLIPYHTFGYAWAAKKLTLLYIGGLYDKGIVGDGDAIMAIAFAGQIDMKPVRGYGDYFKDIQEWQNATATYTRRNIGFVDGAINHLWHGSRKHRRYMSRRLILNSQKFPYKPKEHLYYDANGLLHFQPNVRNFYEEKILKFFSSRQEDLKDVKI